MSHPVGFRTGGTEDSKDKGPVGKVSKLCGRGHVGSVYVCGLNELGRIATGSPIKRPLPGLLRAFGLLSSSRDNDNQISPGSLGSGRR